MIFSGCETVHVSLSTFGTIRACLNVAVLGKGFVSSHLLSPFFVAQDNSEPFLYIFQTRLSSLRSSLLSSGVTKAARSWNLIVPLDLVSHQHKNFGSCWTFHMDVLGSEMGRLA